MNDKPDIPGIITLPPLIYICVFGVALVLESFWRLELPTLPAMKIIGSGLIFLGMAGLCAATFAMIRRKTSVNPYKASTALVTDSLYRFSRNPIYVSDMLIYLGGAVVMSAGWVLLLIPLLIWIMRVGVINREEAYLEQKFGDDYRRYKQQTRRWV